MSSKRLQRETIVFRDSWTGYGSSPASAKDVDTDGYYIAATGWLVSEDRREVRIAIESHDDGGEDDTRVKHVLGIPKVAIAHRQSSAIRLPDPRKKSV